MNTSQHLDWYEITIPRDRKKIGIEYPSHWEKTHVEGKPLNGYDVATRYADGRLEMMSTSQVGMGIHLVISGKPLAVLCPSRESEIEMVEFFEAQGAKMTRIDLAYDVMDYPLSWPDLWKIVEDKNYECRLRGEPLIEHSPQDGDTVYFGKMKSSAFTRIYDKAKEQKIKDKQWVRVETVFRHGRAQSAVNELKKGVSVCGLIAGHLRIPALAWWNEVMAVEPAKTRLNRVDGDKRLEWLLRSVAPTLAREIDLHGDGVWNDFRDAVWSQVKSCKLDD